MDFPEAPCVAVNVGRREAAGSFGMDRVALIQVSLLNVPQRWRTSPMWTHVRGKECSIASADWSCCSLRTTSCALCTTNRVHMWAFCWTTAVRGHGLGGPRSRGTRPRRVLCRFSQTDETSD